MSTLRERDRGAAKPRCRVSLVRHDAGRKVARDEARAQEGFGWGWWEKASGEELAQALNDEVSHGDAGKKL
jgi:hypothetical protein